MEFIAHTSYGSDRTQPLIDHLKSVSFLAGQYSSVFDSSEWGELIGLWHDIGKINPDFQHYIRQASGLIDLTRNISVSDRAHALIGAIALSRQLGKLAIPMAYCIEGHHAGLPNWHNDLDRKLNDDKKYEIVKESIFLDKARLPSSCICKDCKDLHHWIRMLFSCLIDADRIDTERFVDPEQSSFRGKYESMEKLKSKLDAYLPRFDKVADTKLNSDRRTILSICKEKSSLPPGFYSLTVPTGGGKTLSSIQWAINHAIKYKKDRIIIAIPYTSIITQTAAIYRDIFGENNVLEHHSNLSEIDEEKQYDNMSLRLAVENWDIPIVVTTNVQLFESLHSNRPSICRKIHNIANSVLILDEAQMLPIEFLNPVIQGLKSLVSLFHVSVLFTTATQPAFSVKIGLRKSGFVGIDKVEELIPDPEGLYHSFKRTRIQTFHNKKFTPQGLALELIKYDQVLCVVNTRKQAQELSKYLPEDTIHLSRNMYSKHLMQQITHIRDCLVKGISIRVVSTQLIEAGVDIDFPVVYRAFAGLDSIVQAAGRCNREGKYKLGDVFVFEWENEHSHGSIAAGQSILMDMLYHKDIDSLTSPTFMRDYFFKFYCKQTEMDKPKTAELLYKDAAELKLQFEDYANNFQLIDNKGSETFLIPQDEGERIYIRLKMGEKLSLKDYRIIQRYSVTVPKNTAEELRKNRAIEEYGGVKVLSKVFYNKQYGVVVGETWCNEILMV